MILFTIKIFLQAKVIQWFQVTLFFCCETMDNIWPLKLKNIAENDEDIHLIAITLSQKKKQKAKKPNRNKLAM